jgi:hypothetical protein
MRHIDKTKILATKYKEWVNELNNSGEKHPENSRYYIDVVMNLLYCQEGVCAYTEMFLCSPKLLKKSRWENGRYQNEGIIIDEYGNLVRIESKSKKVETLGTLEHFDPELKGEKFWDWDNLFVIHSKINTAKGAQEVDNILKPDSPDYNPFELLTYIENIKSEYYNRKIKKDDRKIFKNNLGYIIETHYFVAHPDRSEDERIRINNMIRVLGLNHDTVCYERETFLNQANEFEFLGIEFKPDRFFTAFEMVKAAKKQEKAGES